jgi:fumarate reductase flavoprotein subunit
MNTRTRRTFLRQLLGSAAAVSSGLAAACAGTEPSDGVSWDEEFDVVVVGGGGAGLVAAIEAVESGASVLVLEKAAAVGGNTARSGAVIQAAGTTFQQDAGVTGDTPDRHRQYYEQAGEDIPDPELLRVLTEQAPDAIAFMSDLGLSYQSVYGVGPIPYVDPDLMVPRIHVPGAAPEIGGGGAHVTALEEAADAGGVEVRTESPVRALIEHESEGIVGVRAEIDGEDRHIMARRGVILCSGGFDRNPDLARALSPQLLWELETGTPFTAESNTGDGLMMGMAVGADLAAIGGTIGVPAITPGAGALAPGLPSIPGLWVDRYGRRFVNEGTHYAYAIRAVFDQEQHVAWAIFDENVRGLGGTAIGGIWGPWSDDLSEEIASGKVRQGDTLADLAGEIGVAADELERTLQSWNDGVAQGEDALFGRTEALVALDTAPYYATRVVSANLGSCGGLRIDLSCRVVDVDGEPIPRLYAAGMVAGGFIGPYYPGSGTAVLATVVFGRIAGREAGGASPAQGVHRVPLPR